MRLLHKLTSRVHKTVGLIVLLICVFNFTSCFYQDDEYSPSHQPGTTWVSSDGRVTINIDENGIGTATVDIDGATYDFKYEEGFYYGSFVIRHGCYIYMEAQNRNKEEPINTKPEQIFEEWNVISYEKDRFTIKSHGDEPYYIYKYKTVIEFHKVK